MSENSAAFPCLPLKCRVADSERRLRVLPRSSEFAFTRSGLEDGVLFAEFLGLRKETKIAWVCATCHGTDANAESSIAENSIAMRNPWWIN